MKSKVRTSQERAVMISTAVLSNDTIVLYTTQTTSRNDKGASMVTWNNITKHQHQFSQGSIDYVKLSLHRLTRNTSRKLLQNSKNILFHRIFYWLSNYLTVWFLQRSITWWPDTRQVQLDDNYGYRLTGLILSLFNATSAWEVLLAYCSMYKQYILHGLTSVLHSSLLTAKSVDLVAT